jgi:uncharacterized protein (TIGR02099 family)
MKAIPRIFLRLAAGAAAFLFIAFLLAVLWLRYWGLPHIDRYRDDIVASISRASGMAVSAQRIRGGWSGLRPYVSLDDFAMNDRRGRVAVAFERAEATLSWWALALGHLRFHDVDFYRPELNLRRAADGLVYLGDKPLNGGADNEEGRFTEWLLAQPRLGIHDARLAWRDEKGGAPEVRLTGVEIAMHKSHGRHHAALEAVPPRELAGRIVMRADVAIHREGKRWRAAGEAFAESRNADLARLRAHLPLPDTLKSGVGSVRVWATFEGETVREVLADLSMRDAVGQLASDALPLQLAGISGRARYRAGDGGFTFATENLKFRLPQGPEILPGNFTIVRAANPHGPARVEVKADGIDLKIAATLLDYFPVPRDVKGQVQRFAPRGRILDANLTWDDPGTGPVKAYAVKGRFEDLAVNAVDALPGVSGLTGRIEGTQAGGTLELASRNVTLALDDVFRAPLVVDRLEARGGWKHVDGNLEVALDEAAFANADAEGTATGTWRAMPHPGARSPGAVDLTGHLTRANAKSVAAYMPNRIQVTRDYLERSIQAGTSPRVAFTIKGDLAEFPFGGESKGLFLVEGDLRDGRLKYHPDWPAVDNVNGTFRFENRRMEIRANRANIFASKSAGVVAAIEDMSVKPAVLTVKGDIDTSGADTVRFLRESPLVKGPGAFTRVVSVEGPARLHIELTYPLAPGAPVEVKGDYRFDGATASVSRTLALQDMKGNLSFTNRGVSAPQITGTLFDRPAVLTMGTQPDAAVVTTVEGSIDAAGMRSYLAPSLAARLEGSAQWRARLTSSKAGNDLVITSDLKGLASTLPQPLAKSAAEEMPATFTVAGLGGEGEATTVAIGADIHGRVSRAAEDQWNAALKFGAPLGSEPLREGLWLYGQLAALDIDAWQAVFEAPRGQATPAAQKQAIELRGVDLRLGKAHYWDRDFTQVHASLARSGTQWKGHLQSTGLEGDIDWDWEKKRLVGRFERLALGDATTATRAAAPRAEVTELPAIDVTARKFDLKGRWLGALDLKAENAGAEWRIDRLDIANPHAKLTSKGVWRRTATGSLTTLDIKLDAGDLNALFGQFGFADYMKRGSGALEGQLAWPGTPQEFAVANLAGTLKVEARRGQFAKIDAGAGKMLGLLSLQSLPRRAMFDFSDVFSAGFAFERIQGDVKVARGVLLTDNFEISGGSAFVSMSGEVSIPQETQALTMHVVPEVGEGLALAATVVGTPVLGLSTLLVSKLLNNPFGKVVAYEYRITGSWDNPQVVRTSAAPPKTAATPQPPAAQTAQQQ